MERRRTVCNDAQRWPPAVTSRRAARLGPVTVPRTSGRRFPSEEALTHIARALNTTLADLRKYDTRPPIEEMKRRTAENPALGVAFRKIVDLPQEELLRIANRGAKKK